jgi:hypothetical protein
MIDNLLFVWIPKCAGTSLFETLRPKILKLRDPKDYKHFKNKGWVTFGHVDINYLKEKEIINREFLKHSFKFAIVRNPWDRAVSVYKYKKLDKHLNFEEYCYLLKRYLKSKKQPDNNLINKILINNKIKKGIPKIGKYNEIGISHANRQLDWITNNKNEIFVDKIYKLENIEDDMKDLSTKIGININLPKKNSSKRGHYKNYYNETSRKIIESIYEQDIKTFNYKF